jgi:protein O-mannosyl-transferase
MRGEGAIKNRFENSSESGVSDAGKNRRLVLSLCVILVIVPLAVFWQVKNHDFITLDDYLYVTENAHVQEGVSFEGLKWALTAGHASNWHPLTWLSHMLDVQLFGLNAGRHHLMNVFFHIMNALLLFLILRRMTKGLWQSAFVAALFALHPLHVESVAWVAERKDVLSTLFWMLTLGAYAYYAERPEVQRYLFVLGFFVLGLMSKPMLVTLPFVLLLLDYWPLGRFQQVKQDRDHPPNLPPPKNITQEKKKRVKVPSQKAGQQEGQAGKPAGQPRIRLIFLEKVPLLVFSIISSVITVCYQHDALSSLQLLPMNERISNTLVSYVKYLVMAIWPRNIAVFYPLTDVQPLWQILAAALVLLAATSFCIWKTRRFPYLGVGWFWYLGTLVPVIGLVQVGSQAMADRYSYVPLIGVFIMTAWGIPELLKNRDHRKVLLGMLSGIAILACIVLTWVQLGLWQDSVTLFSHALKVTTNNYFAHKNLGIALLNQGKSEDAMDHFRAALHINQGDALTWNSLGTAYEKSGQTAKAVEAYQQSLRINPQDANSWNNLGIAYGKSGQMAKAVEALQRALRINPKHEEAWNNLGNALGESGKRAEAIEAYRQALNINPKHANAWNNLGTVYGESGEITGAIEAFQRALQVNPERASVWNNLGMVYRKSGQTDKAIEAFQEALRANPRYAKAWFGLGVVYREAGRREQALEVYEQLRSIDPAAADELLKR